MILFSKENKAQAIDALDLVCKTFLAHGMAKPEFHKIVVLLNWMRQQKEDLNVSAKITANEYTIHFEVVCSFIEDARTDAEAN